MCGKLRIALIAFVLLLTTAFGSQAQTTAQERAARLQTQLAELQSKQVEITSRLEVVNEQLKPENIEKSLAGVGSTKPEDLRELRRRQLEKQKNGIEQQLAVLIESRLKLESAIVQADALAYQQSALPSPEGEKVSATASSSPTSSRPKQAAKKKVRPRRMNR